MQKETESQEFPQARRTLPWLDDEYMLVDGMRIVYDVDKKTGEFIVRMPGRITTSVASLRGMGCRVILPKRVRTEHFS